MHRVFISSTAIDLQDHRKAVQDAILRKELLPIGMERFGAASQAPVDLCRDKVQSCDAVVVLVAHRYGWVPAVEQGGDGQKSITWYEVEFALAADIPVLAYLIDPDHEWPHPSEERRVRDAADEAEALRVWRAVKALDDFKDFLNNKAGITRDTFSTEDKLATKVIAALDSVNPRDTAVHDAHLPRTAPKPAYARHIYHPLQPASHFRGREDILEELADWWNDPAHPDRVKSLVALGGAGKTAIAAKFLDGIPEDNLPGHVFEWSFYENPNADDFLYEACAVFLGEEPEGQAGGRLARLQRELRDGSPHVFVLDGLERVQSEGRADHAFGELEDHQLKNFLRSIASGLGQTRALVTTRFRMADLQQWERAGHRTYELKHLDESAAVAVLRGWSVQGLDDRLARLAKDVGYHALSVSVLGSFLREFAGGDPEQAPDFDISTVAGSDPAAAKLGRILTSYDKALPKPERDLLIRLSIFPRGVSVQIMGYIVHAGGQIAGALVGAGQAQLLHLARSLERIGLAFHYGAGDGVRFTAHPAVREYFRGLAGVQETEIHETVRAGLAPNLESRPESKPSDKATLDRYEELIEHTIGAGDYKTAFDLYWDGLGDYKNLGWKLGEYTRGVRILSRFLEEDDTGRVQGRLGLSEQGRIANNIGLHAHNAGDLAAAERGQRVALQLATDRGGQTDISIANLNLAVLCITKAAFPAAAEHARQALRAAREADDDTYRIYSLAYQAFALHAAGQTDDATTRFSEATALQGEPLDALYGVYETLHRLDLGDRAGARQQTESNLATCRRNDLNHIIAQCHYALGLLDAYEDGTAGNEHLTELRDWSDRTGQMEAILQGHHLASEIARHAGDIPGALAEAETGLTTADGNGFHRYSIQLLISLARAHLEAPDPRAALGRAQEALDRATHKDCHWAWAEADAAHLCGIAHHRLGERDLAIRRFREALAVRERIQHPEADETRQQLTQLGAPPAAKSQSAGE